MSFVVIIPARLGSTRLPGKALREIHGKPMIGHVCDRARESQASRIIVATDDPGIQDACKQFGVETCMTSERHASGTDRIAEAARACNLGRETVVINLQGDEPLMDPTVIDGLGSFMNADSVPDIGTVATPIRDDAEYRNPNVVKVVADARGRALYFSRAPIPHNRVADGTPPQALRHLGLYAYSVATLEKFVTLPRAELEITESLEQLRALSNDVSIGVQVIREAPPHGVDTEADLELATKLLAKKK